MSISSVNVVCYSVAVVPDSTAVVRKCAVAVVVDTAAVAVAVVVDTVAVAVAVVVDPPPTVLAVGYRCMFASHRYQSLAPWRTLYRNHLRHSLQQQDEEATSR